MGEWLCGVSAKGRVRCGVKCRLPLSIWCESGDGGGERYTVLMLLLGSRSGAERIGVVGEVWVVWILWRGLLEMMRTGGEGTALCGYGSLIFPVAEEGLRFR